MKENKSSELKDLSYKEMLLRNFVIAWNINVSFSFVSDFMISRLFREIINNIGDLIWLNWRSKARIVSVIDELANNAIEHWSKKGDINKLRINIDKEYDGLVISIEVEDTGNWVSPKKAFEMRNLRDMVLKRWFSWHKSIRWRGLFMIIINLVDDLYFNDSKEGGLVVWVKKKLSYEDF